jgi:hypothetical protein
MRYHLAAKKMRPSVTYCKGTIYRAFAKKNHTSESLKDYTAQSPVTRKMERAPEFTAAYPRHGDGV